MPLTPAEAGRIHEPVSRAREALLNGNATRADAYLVQIATDLVNLTDYYTESD